MVAEGVYQTVCLDPVASVVSAVSVTSVASVAKTCHSNPASAGGDRKEGILNLPIVAASCIRPLSGGGLLRFGYGFGVAGCLQNRRRPPVRPDVILDVLAPSAVGRSFKILSLEVTHV
jgi:hypothetical protein